MYNIGVIASQFFLGNAPPPADIYVDTISVGGEFIASYTTAGAIEKNQLPVASGVQIVGMTNVGESIDGTWQYFHINNSVEGSTIIELRQADDVGMSVNVSVIATSFPFTLITSGKYIRLDITPVTIDGTEGVVASSSVFLVGTSLIQKQVKISLGSATKPFSGTNWNLAHTNNPDATYELNNLINADGLTITGLNLDVDLAMSDQNLGSASAGTGDASEFPANSAKEYWYPSSGTRGFVIEIPSGGLGTGIGEIKLLCNLASGTNAGQYSVNGITINLPNVTANPPGNGNIAYFTEVNLTSNITIRAVDGTGICPINAIIIYYYEES